MSSLFGDRWLLEKSAAHELAAVLRVDGETLAAAAGRAPRAAIQASDTGVVNVRGVLLSEPSALYDLLGVQYTTYSEIVAQLDEHASARRDVVLAIDSPGGQVKGLYDAMDAVATYPGRVTARVSGLAASAAYMLASQADEIVATSPADQVGSVGVVVSLYRDDNEYTITNTASPNKAPDPASEAGQRAIQEELDDIFAVFLERIAAGRKTTPEAVLRNYGQGAVYTARTALQKGMIDKLEVTMSDKNQAPQEAKSEADVKAEVVQIDASVAFEDGVGAERDRCLAHLKLAAASGLWEFAVQCIERGDVLTDAVKAEHIAATMKVRQAEERANDDVSVRAVEPVETAAEAAQKKLLAAAKQRGVMIEW